MLIKDRRRFGGRYRRRSERRQRPRDLVVPLRFLQLGQLVLGARAKTGDVEDSVYSSVYLAVCVGVDSRMASVCSNLIFYRFMAEDLAAYKSLTDNRSEFMTTCKSRDA